MASTYFFASGKGGAGKSTITAGIGTALARLGSKVVIIDADIGLRGQDAFLCLDNNVVYDIVDVIRKDCGLDQALLQCPDIPGLFLLPASQFARAKDLEPKHLRRLIRSLRTGYDFILIDCPAGIERGLRNIINTGIAQAVVVATPDDLCIRDAEKVIDLLSEKGIARPSLIVNRLNRTLIRKGEMLSAAQAASVLDLPLLGEVPDDSTVYRVQLRHGRLIDYDCEARNSVIRIARRIKGETVPLPSYGSSVSLRERIMFRRLKEVISIDNH